MTSLAFTEVVFSFNLLSTLDYLSLNFKSLISILRFFSWSFNCLSRNLTWADSIFSKFLFLILLYASLSKLFSLNSNSLSFSLAFAFCSSFCCLYCSNFSFCLELNFWNELLPRILSFFLISCSLFFCSSTCFLSFQSSKIFFLFSFSSSNFNFFSGSSISTFKVWFIASFCSINAACFFFFYSWYLPTHSFLTSSNFIYNFYLAKWFWISLVVLVVASWS